MPPKFAAPKKGKQPKETVVYPASKRKAPPFKPQRPGNAKAAKASESSAAADARSRPVSGGVLPARASVDDVEEAEGDEDHEQAEGGTAGSAQPGASECEGAGDDESEEELAADPLAAQPKAPLRRQAEATRPPAKKPSSASTTARRQTTRPRSSMSISDDDDNSNNNNNKDTTHRAPLSSPPPPPPQPTPSSEIPRIPQPLLLRLLHEAFRDKQTRIDTHALQVLEKYLEVFVREAVARTALRKREAAARGEVPASEARWLELEDLEKVAPGLVMDF